MFGLYSLTSCTDDTVPVWNSMFFVNGMRPQKDLAKAAFFAALHEATTRLFEAGSEASKAEQERGARRDRRVACHALASAPGGPALPCGRCGAARSHFGSRLWARRPGASFFLFYFAVPVLTTTRPMASQLIEQTPGETEQQCKDQGKNYVTGQFPFAASGRAMSLMETEGFVKVIADADTDEVLGVHMVGPEVTELIAEATLAIEMGATTEDIARTIHAHPTLPEAMMEAAEAVHKMAVHIFQKPFVTSLDPF